MTKWPIRIHSCVLPYSKVFSPQDWENVCASFFLLVRYSKDFDVCDAFFAQHRQVGTRDLALEKRKKKSPFNLELSCFGTAGRGVGCRLGFSQANKLPGTGGVRSSVTRLGGV